MENKYIIDEREFKKLYKAADETHRLAKVTYEFCQENLKEYPIFDEIIPIVNYLKLQATQLIIYFIRNSKY